MTAITSRTDPGPDRELLRATIRSLGLRCGPLELMSPNSKRVVLSDRDYILARAQREADPTLRDPANELAWAARFSLAVPVQAPLHRTPVRTPDGWLVTVWQYLPGTQRRTVEDAYAHGALIRTVHDQVTIPPGAAAVDQLAIATTRVRMLADAGHPHAAMFGDLLAAAEGIVSVDADGPLVASHGDVNPNTVLAGPRGAVLMDFDSSGAAPRLLDVGSGNYTYGRYLSAEHAAAFLDGYGADADERVAAHGWVRALRVAVARAAVGKDASGDLGWLAANRPSA